MKSVIARISLAEHASLLKLLHDDGLTISGFITACVTAYIRGDKSMTHVVGDHKRLSSVSKDSQSGHVLSPLDRRALFDEIEKLEGDE